MPRLNTQQLAKLEHDQRLDSLARPHAMRTIYPIQRPFMAKPFNHALALELFVEDYIDEVEYHNAKQRVAR